MDAWIETVGKFLEGGNGVIVFWVLLAFGALAAYALVKRTLLRFLQHASARTRNRWDDALMQRRVFEPLAYLAPAVVVYYGLDFQPAFAQVLNRLLLAWLEINVALIMSRLMYAGLDIYETLPADRRRPIKGYVQLANIILYALVAVLALCAILDKSPWGILSGIGAMTAILILVFRDTILSLIASVQIAAYDLVRRGDWIEVPAYGADGDVIDIALHAIRVQNWDKTIVTVPTYKLIDGGFKNWRGMNMAGGRRIKRSLLIDQTSVRFLDEDLLARLSRIRRLGPYFEAKLAEIGTADSDLLPIDRRTLTNLGTFRAYVNAYLHDHRELRADLTFLVRHLAPTPAGLPIEIYVFSRDTRWEHYERIQADIFDHLIAAVPYFELRLFQNPSAYDMRQWSERVS